MNKDTFVGLIQAGFIGTSGNASEKLALFIDDAISRVKFVIYAMDGRMYAPPSKNQPLKRTDDEAFFPENWGEYDELLF